MFHQYLNQRLSIINWNPSGPTAFEAFIFSGCSTCLSPWSSLSASPSQGWRDLAFNPAPLTLPVNFLGKFERAVTITLIASRSNSLVVFHFTHGLSQICLRMHIIILGIAVAFGSPNNPFLLYISALSLDAWHLLSLSHVLQIISVAICVFTAHEGPVFPLLAFLNDVSGQSSFQIHFGGMH